MGCVIHYQRSEVQDKRTLPVSLQRDGFPPPSPAFHNVTTIINHSRDNVPGWVEELCAPEVFILTRFPAHPPPSPPAIHHACTALSLHGHLHGRAALTA